MMDWGAIERFLDSIEQLTGWLQLLVENWWLLAIAAGVILAVVLVKNAKAILHTLAVAIGIGVVLVVALAIVGMPGEQPAVSAPAPVAHAPATASNPATLLCAGSALTLLALAGAAVGGVYLYRRFLGDQQGASAKWLPGLNALWGRPSYSHGAPTFYVVDEEGDEIAALIMADPDLWGLSAPLQGYDRADWG